MVVVAPQAKRRQTEPIDEDRASEHADTTTTTKLKKMRPTSVSPYASTPYVKVTEQSEYELDKDQQHEIDDDVDVADMMQGGEGDTMLIDDDDDYDDYDDDYDDDEDTSTPQTSDDLNDFIQPEFEYDEEDLKRLDFSETFTNGLGVEWPSSSRKTESTTQERQDNVALIVARDKNQRQLYRQAVPTYTTFTFPAQFDVDSGLPDYNLLLALQAVQIVEGKTFLWVVLCNDRIAENVGKWCNYISNESNIEQGHVVTKGGTNRNLSTICLTFVV